MAFVARTTRESNRVGMHDGGSTPAHVGPGSYRSANSIRKARPSYAAFGSVTERMKSKATKKAPGPGAYGSVLRLAKRAQASSNAFRSKTARFNRKVNTGELMPGPGSYNHRSTFKVVSKVPPVGSFKKNSEQIRQGVEWLRVPSAPSIPAPNQSYGYEEGKYGELILQRPPEIGHSGRANDAVGPGSYDPSNNFLKTKLPNSFGSSRSTRTDFTKQSGGGGAPGPGSYIDGMSTRESGPTLVPEGATAPRQKRASRKIRPNPTSMFASKTARSGPSKVSLPERCATCVQWSGDALVCLVFCFGSEMAPIDPMLLFETARFGHPWTRPI